MTMLFAVGVLALVVASGCFIWLTVLAFKESVGWGLAVFFIPFAFIFFAVKHWPDAKRPFLSYMGTTVAGVMLLFASGIMAGMKAGAMMEEEMLAAMQEAEQQGFDFDDPTPAPDPVESPEARPAPRPIVVESENSMPSVEPEPAPARAERRVSKLPPDGKVPVSRADRYVGERVRVTGRGGLETTGTLRSARGDRLVLEKDLGGGIASFELSRREIDTLVILRR